jgi:hypothetical protein
MAIRDKIIVKTKSTAKPYAVEVNRPGGRVEAVVEHEQLLTVREMTRKGVVLRWASFALDDLKSVEFTIGR